jgi:hypothetical protein
MDFKDVTPEGMNAYIEEEKTSKETDNITDVMQKAKEKYPQTLALFSRSLLNFLGEINVQESEKQKIIVIAGYLLIRILRTLELSQEDNA